MDNNQISFENLPSVVSKIFNDVSEIKKLLTENRPREPNDNGTLSLKNALIFLSTNGYEISKSKLYKLTSTGKIPYSKLNNKLIFYKNELSQWLNSQIVKNPNTLSESEYSIILSAQKKHLNGKG